MIAYTNERNEIVALRTRPAWDTENTLTETELPTDIFEGKCDAFIMGYRYGEEVCGEDAEGNPIKGIVCTPYKDLGMLDALQNQYEQTKREGAEGGSVPSYVPIALSLAAANFTDKQALQVPELYAEWKSYIGKPLKQGVRVRYEDRLYKVRQDISVVLENQPPSIDTAALYEEICEDHEGTLEDPIPYNNNMELFEGKYYSQDGVVYKCTRNTEQAVYNPLKDLVNIYVEVVE